MCFIKEISFPLLHLKSAPKKTHTKKILLYFFKKISINLKEE